MKYPTKIYMSKHSDTQGLCINITCVDKTCVSLSYGKLIVYTPVPGLNMIMPILLAVA